MKGLFLINLNKKDQAYECVKRGVRNDLTSHICWHVYGLIYRADKNYDEAIKCYSNALRQDKSNFTIQRDLSFLQIQMRNYDGFAESSLSMLMGKSSNRVFWLSYAVANHLLKEYELAVAVIDAYMGSLKDERVDFENSEIWMYKNMILEESGNLPLALSDLDVIRDKVVDKTGWKRTRARILTSLGKLDEARDLYKQLFESNVESLEYLQHYAQSSGLDLDCAAYAWICGLARAFPKSNLLARLVLQTAPDSEFERAADAWLKKQLHKGVPSTFVAMKSLYTPHRAEIVETLIRSYLVNLEAGCGFDGVAEPPTAWLWTTIFLAQHSDWKGDFESALELIDKAMQHTPTLVETYMLKARFLKHAGSYDEAARVMDAGREIDLQDRFVNSKSVKYWLRAGNISVAERVVKLFTKPDAKDPLADITEMQTLWFATERAAQGGEAGLKECEFVERVFADIYEDQFDFHGYCMRKMTLRSYVNLLRWEDSGRAHPYFRRAARLGARIVLAGKADGGLDRGDKFVAPLLEFSDPEGLVLGVEFYARKRTHPWSRD